MKISISFEKPIKYNDKIRRYNVEPDLLFEYCRLLLVSNDLEIKYLDRESRILDTRIKRRSKINIKVTDYSLVRVNILNADSVSPYERFFESLEYLLKRDFS